MKQAAPEPAADSGEGLLARAQLRVGVSAWRLILPFGLGNGFLLHVLMAAVQHQVARVLTVEEINSDKLFKTTIDIGGGEVRQVKVALMTTFASGFGP